jgi:GR25 family glycosyltransferase involved in LPS biosynthesis
VITAIDWFFSKVKEGIILEDDLYFNENFIDFASDALDYFQDDSDTWLISGNNFDPKISEFETNSWSTYPLIWGWATWKSKWEVMRAELLSGESLSQIPASRKVRSFWRTAYERAMTGKTDSWAAPLAAVQHSNSKFTVVPKYNLVSNIGNDESAIHTAEGSAHMNLVIPIQKIQFQFSFQNRKEEADKTDAFLEKYVYKITWANNFSQLALRVFDWLRFPRKYRKTSLSERLNG